MALRARHDLICSLSAVLFLLSVNVTGPCFSSAQQCILAFSPIYNTLLWISSLLISQLSSFPTDGLSERLLPVLFRMITLPFHIKPPNSKYLLYHIFFSFKYHVCPFGVSYNSLTSHIYDCYVSNCCFESFICV